MGAAVSSCSSSSCVEGYRNKRKTRHHSSRAHYDKTHPITTTLWLRENNGTTTTYRGQVNRHGQPHGLGSSHYENGDMYSGSWKRGVRTGCGTMTFAKSGSQYHGYFFNNEFHGPGDFCWSDGQAYSGDFHHGQMHGYGTYSYGDYFYKGCYKHGKRLARKGLWYDSEWGPVSSDVHKNDPGHQINEIVI